MATEHVASGQWISFFQSFSRRHAGWLVKVEVLGERIGAQVEVDSLPLEGITLEHDEGSPSVEITVVDRRGGHLTHMVSDVRDVWLKTEDGADQALELAAASAVTLVTFRSALVSDAVAD
jgi:hypothetical protein